MKGPDLEKLRRSGFISATAREHGKKLIKPGARIEAIAREVEQVIFDMGGKPAFPAQLSRNHIAAHYCSPPDDPTTLGPDDIVKLDLGTQVDGYVTLVYLRVRRAQLLRCVPCWPIVSRLVFEVSNLSAAGCRSSRMISPC